mmetsp:Transcript_22024/g.28526  ORF Transcript_22024/g.28526 Transcript_22024/m.28526 type:complete len:144 (-) Transcript_22024:734-1165(-)|eukprot:CAMPEP_0197330288 /NCGR_PEP_ID=MMETSP0892-20130614/6650_1 /TAXON_ID=44058 ORGANISM="Aureoumbra lagunensis, Strain CCMP1510" /NCGR_SAMPLE_ID=MMETSP0892 /ASSEMBLY_ACC=CAM_ASM_000538 /LENGTH=143 /DNA_ID=CAMNT_0042827397 /DNA_START=64 /DNA_END=495 /DNA_ORIENTATION=-
MKVVAIASLVACASAFTPAKTTPSASVKMMGVKEDMAAAALAAATLVTPVIASAADLDNGATIFAGNCAACHAGGNNVIQTEKTLKKEALDEYLSGGRKVESVVYQVTNGKNAMPAFGGRLSDDEIADVASYVIDQANGDKWE